MHFDGHHYFSGHHEPAFRRHIAHWRERGQGYREAVDMLCCEGAMILGGISRIGRVGCLIYKEIIMLSVTKPAARLVREEFISITYNLKVAHLHLYRLRHRRLRKKQRHRLPWQRRLSCQCRLHTALNINDRIAPLNTSDIRFYITVMVSRKIINMLYGLRKSTASN